MPTRPDSKKGLEFTKKVTLDAKLIYVLCTSWSINWSARREMANSYSLLLKIHTLLEGAKEFAYLFLRILNKTLNLVIKLAI